MKKFLIIFFATLLVAAIIYFGVSFYIANKFLQPLRIQFTEKSTDIAPNGIDFETTTSDNIKLSGWLFKNSAPCVVMLVPGIHQNRISGDYGGGEIAKLALEKGYGVVVYDPRGTGLSEGNVLGFGSTEVNDTNAILSYLQDEGYAKNNIAIIGSSLGAITTLQNLENTKDTGALVIDSAATAIKPLIEREMKKENIPVFLNPGVFLISKLFYGADIESVRPIDKVKEYSTKPIMFIHGVKDSFIPFSNSQELVNVSKEGILIPFENADHVQSFKSDPEKYEQEVFSYLSSQMPQCSQEE